MRKVIRRPTHPGNIIKEDYLLPLSITIKDMADTLGVSRKTLSKIINERGAIMALRLSRAFDTFLVEFTGLWHAEKGSQELRPFPKNMLHQQNSSLGSEQVIQD